MNANRKARISARFREAFGVRHVPVSLWIERSMARKAVRGRSALQTPKVFARPHYVRNSFSIRVNQRDSRAENLRKAQRFSPVAVWITRISKERENRRKQRQRRSSAISSDRNLSLFTSLSSVEIEAIRRAQRW